MKAIVYDRFGGPGVMRLADIAEPPPGPDEALIRVRAASVIPGDWKLRAGRLQDMFPISFPKIPGRDGAGEVVALGPGTDFAAIGDRVVFVTGHAEPGSHAEFVVRGRDSTVALPAGLDFARGAALMHAGACAWTALVRTGGVAPGMRVLVHGAAGAVGGAAVQIARNAGAEVLATCHSRNADYVRGLGAAEIAPYDTDDFAARFGRVDLVLDTIGGDVHRRSYAVLRRGGAIVWLIAEPFEDLSAAYGVRTVQADIRDDREVLEAVAALAARGALVPQVSRIMDLAQVAEAHRLLESGAISRGRIVLRA